MLMFQLLSIITENNDSEAMDAYTVTFDEENMPDGQFTQDTSIKTGKTRFYLQKYKEIDVSY